MCKSQILFEFSVSKSSARCCRWFRVIYDFLFFLLFLLQNDRINQWAKCKFYRLDFDRCYKIEIIVRCCLFIALKWDYFIPFSTHHNSVFLFACVCRFINVIVAILFCIFWNWISFVFAKFMKWLGSVLTRKIKICNDERFVAFSKSLKLTWRWSRPSQLACVEYSRIHRASSCRTQLTFWSHLCLWFWLICLWILPRSTKLNLKLIEKSPLQVANTACTP